MVTRAALRLRLLDLLLRSSSQEAILDIKRIRVSYLRTWFIPDVIAAFPIGYILLFAVIMSRLLRQRPVRCYSWFTDSWNNVCFSVFQDLQYHNDDNPSKTNKMMRILMFVRILSLIRLARVSRLVRFFNEVEKVSSDTSQTSNLNL